MDKAMKRVSGSLRRNRSHPGCRREGGVVAIIVALSLVVLVGFAGLALDLGKLYVAKSELQNSADACALAAARELTGANTNQLVLAEAAGMTAGMRHDVLFQDEMIALAVDDSVAIGPTEAVLMQYARCTVERTGIANWFIQVLNLLPAVASADQAVAAAAVATRTPSQVTSCAIPVGVCSSAITPSTPPGTWLQSVIGPAPSGGGSGNLTGNFMWVDYTPPGGGASELVGILTGPGVCNLPAIGTQVGEAGVMSSLAAHWNSRFGIGGVDTGLYRPRLYRCRGKLALQIQCICRLQEQTGGVCALSGGYHYRAAHEWNDHRLGRPPGGRR
ncbi:MAG: hypothetical protein HKUEN07_06960 [Rhodocyclaceae bacterium]|nr:MAG: hypothetical protein HKUEN07_06960 [Rhodocyclaceae bacterium]